MAGDHKQPRPLIVSIGVGLNPSAAQVGISLFARLVLSRFYTYKLVRSGRMHQELLPYPNKRTYGGELIATKEANLRLLPDSYRTWYEEYFQQKDSTNCRLIGLLVEGTCERITSKIVNPVLAPLR